VIIDEDVHLMHYGVIRRSGRYPWGSGGDELQSESGDNKDFLGMVASLKNQGLSDKEIADGFGMTQLEFRSRKTVERNAQRQADISRVQRLKDKGNSPQAIAQATGLPASTVRNYLKPGEKDKVDILTNTAHMLRLQVAEKKLIDVGAGVEVQLNMSKEKLAAAISILKGEGYVTHVIRIPQATTQHETDVKVLAAPGTTWGDVNKNKHQIQQINIETVDGKNFTKEHPPIAVDPKRVGIVYNEDGGGKRDGVVYVRPNSKDLSMGGSRYAQVRIKVGDDHFIKGMAMYSDKMPEGIDLLFHTSKSDTGNKLDALKPITDDPDLPFGAVIKKTKKQLLADPGLPTERNTSALNIVNEEGDWTSWSKSLSPQFLSKQHPTLAKEQLDLSTARRQAELEEIMSLSNPVVKKKLLRSYADATDAASINLAAAALADSQRWHAILPVSSMKPDEVYAPNYPNGSKVVLVRFPHGGTFEIPELTVNNKQAEARRLFGTAPIDAVGIHHSVAERLSGADFDGDTVIVIPNDSKKVTSTAALKGLSSFAPRVEYKAFDGMTPITEAQKQTEMGKISNLITDMTVRGASPEEMVRAIKHSMVVIDSWNHTLNWKLSEQQNGIRQLKQEYQSIPTQGRAKGASTLLSKAGAEYKVPHRKDRPSKEGGPIDVETGKKMRVPSGKTYKNGAPVNEMTTRMAETDDAHTLSSGVPIESIYADYANETKALANKARLEMIRTPSLKYSRSSKTAYASEVASLNSKLALAVENRPRERQAQILADAVISAKRHSNPNMSESTRKKVAIQAINTARTRVDADKKKRMVEITPTEWDAIQAGAISNHKLEQILTNTDLELLRQYATPHTKVEMVSSRVSQAQQMLALGYTRAEVAGRLGVSVTTLNTALKGDDE
jgi:DNA-binding CsgD family transcriptional regulator